MRKKNEFVYDAEVYKNRFGVGLLNVRTGKKRFFDDLLQIASIPFEDDRYLFIGFNNFRYDQPLIEHVLEGADPYQTSKNLITGKLETPSWNENCIDLYNQLCPRPARKSLKAFGHQLKHKILMNLPYPYDQTLTDLEWENVRRYNLDHDLEITNKLWSILRPEYESRSLLKKYFDCNVHFRGAPGVAEKCMLSKLGNSYITEVPIGNGFEDKSNVLKEVENLVLSPDMQKLYKETFSKSIRTLFSNTTIAKQCEVNGIKLDIKLGGLHGVRNPGIYCKAYDYDVTSFYTSIILNCKLGSAAFRREYRKIYEERLRLKAAGEKSANALKLVLNSLTGKLASPYSDEHVYAPHLALSMRLLGEFYIIDLIEKLEFGQCIAANTDGIMTVSPIAANIVNEWELRTGFKLEKTEYEVLILKDVSSYYAIDTRGKEKRKSIFLEPCWDHNVKTPIVQKAVLNKILLGTKIEDTILNASDPYDFSWFKQVTGENKLELGGKDLEDPKIRFFVSKVGEELISKTYGTGEERRAQVVKGHFITLMMNIPDTIEQIKNSIDYDYYIEQAYKLYEKINVMRKGTYKTVRQTFSTISESRSIAM